MNQSKHISRLCPLLFTVAFVCLIFSDINALGNDPNGYAIDITHMASIPSSWQSPLFIYEGRLIAYLASLLNINYPDLLTLAGINFGWLKIEYAPGILALYAYWAITICFVYFSLFFFIKKITKTENHHIVFTVVLCSLFLFIRIFHYFHFGKYLDGYFTNLLLSSVFLLYFSTMLKGWKKAFIYAVVFFFIIHCFMFRKNALALIPFISYYLVNFSIQIKSARKRIIYAILTTCALSGAACTLYKIIPSRPSHPAIVMLASEIKDAALLKGDEQVLEEISDSCGLQCRYENIICPEYWLEGLSDFTDEEWATFLGIFKNYSLENPSEMFAAHIIQITQFICNGYVPSLEKRVIQYCFPNSDSEAQWEWKAYCSIGGYEKIWLYLVAIALFVIARTRKIKDSQNLLKLADCLFVLSFAYTFSFFFVVPTPDNRYHAFSVMGLCISSSIYVSLLLAPISNKFLKGIARRKQDDSSPQPVSGDVSSGEKSA